MAVVVLGVPGTSPTPKVELPMPRYSLETLVIILVILWLLGWLVIPIAGSLIHLLLVIVLVIVVVRLLQGRRPLG